MMRCVWAKSCQSCPTLCNSMDCSLPGFSVHGILQARILEWVALLQGIFPTQGSNLCLMFSCTGRQILNRCTTKEVLKRWLKDIIQNTWPGLLKTEKDLKKHRETETGTDQRTQGDTADGCSVVPGWILEQGVHSWKSWWNPNKVWTFLFVCFGMQHLISLTRDRTHSPCIGSVECQPLDHKASPRVWILVNRDVPMLVFFLALTNVPQWCEMWELCVLSLQFFCKLKIKPEIKNLFKKKNPNSWVL